MKKRRTPKAMKALNLFASLELVTVLWWEQSLAADSINTPLTDSSQIILWGSLASIFVSLLFFSYLRTKSKRRRRLHPLAGAEERLAVASNAPVGEPQSLPC